MTDDSTLPDRSPTDAELDRLGAALGVPSSTQIEQARARLEALLGRRDDVEPFLTEEVRRLYDSGILTADSSVQMLPDGLHLLANKHPEFGGTIVIDLGDDVYIECSRLNPALLVSVETSGDIVGRRRDVVAAAVGDEVADLMAAGVDAPVDPVAAPPWVQHLAAAALGRELNGPLWSAEMLVAFDDGDVPISPVVRSELAALAAPTLEAFAGALDAAPANERYDRLRDAIGLLGRPCTEAGVMPSSRLQDLVNRASVPTAPPVPKKQFLSHSATRTSEEDASPVRPGFLGGAGPEHEASEVNQIDQIDIYGVDPLAVKEATWRVDGPVVAAQVTVDPPQLEIWAKVIADGEVIGSAPVLYSNPNTGEAWVPIGVDDTIDRVELGPDDNQPAVTRHERILEAIESLLSALLHDVIVWRQSVGPEEQSAARLAGALHLANLSDDPETQYQVELISRQLKESRLADGDSVDVAPGYEPQLIAATCLQIDESEFARLINTAGLSLQQRYLVALHVRVETDDGTIRPPIDAIFHYAAEYGRELARNDTFAATEVIRVALDRLRQQGGDVRTGASLTRCLELLRDLSAIDR